MLILRFGVFQYHCSFQYTTKRESTAEDYQSLKKEYDTIDAELKKLRETYNLRQDTWIKEKLAMQVKLIIQYYLLLAKKIYSIKCLAKI